MKKITRCLGYLAVVAFSIAILYFTCGSSAGCWIVALIALIIFNQMS